MEDIVAGYGDWFSAQLIRLIAKADRTNIEILRKAYPEHVEAYESWYHAPRETAT
jgi:hypothetical protein